MATKVKPCRIKATGTPQAGDVPKYVDEDTFQWGAGGGGSGDVVGPASSTDGHLAVFDGATGKLIKDGGAIPTGDVGVSTDTGTLLSAGVDLWLGTETDFSSISTPDTNTLYIQYKSDGGGGWQPGVNTVAYYPLDTDFSDASGNGYDLTATNTTITTLGGIDCASYTGGRAYNSSAPVGTQRTLSAWIYNPGTSGVIVGTGESQDSFYGIMLYLNASRISVSDFHQGGAEGTIPTQNAWHHVLTTADNSTLKIYMDGTLIASGTHTRTDSSTGISAGGKPFTNEFPDVYTGYLSNVIVENVVRTAQEIADYYNSTKSDYGIS